MTEKEVKKRSVTLQEARIGTSEERRRDWVVNAEEGTTLQDVLDPVYWAHVSPRFTPYDRIDVRLETGEWVAELLVISVDRNWARVHLLHHYDLQAHEQEAPAPLKYEIYWRGPQHKWAVRRLSDMQVVQEDFADKGAAAVWLKNYEQVTMTT